ncbi:HNH endonuclease signature motif containing protein [Modestobacter altitudinis]|uniref:HNH endonuclease signature motif containing protein n=1 Tax=Modestobacter altitudinis TaxID=2213158 RepID=UPI00110D0CD6|nr:HNH endonuclease signature motif containing protein [Modestobacter altitudinis]
MFERLATLTPDHDSRFESQLRALLDGAEFELAAGFLPHGSPPCPGAEQVPGAARLQRLLDEGGDHLGRAAAAHLAAARAAAEQAEALAAFARCRPSSLDRPDTEIGAAAARTRAARAGRPAALTEVSEWAVDEVAVALQLTSAAASALLVDSVLLVDRLPATLAALHEGRISWRHAQVMTDLVSRLPDELRPTAEARLLSRVGGKTHSQLRVAARRVVMRLDAEALVERVREAVRGRRVVLHPGDDGMATLSAVLPIPVARAVLDALRQYAEAVDDDERTLAQRMVDCLVDLVLRPGEHGMPPVQARLTLVAAVETLLGSDEPGEVDGDLVPAEMVRQLAEALGLLPRAEDAAPADEPRSDELSDGPQSDEPLSDEPLSDEPLSDEPLSDEPRSGESVEGERVPGEPGRAGERTVQALARLLRSRSLAGSALARRPHVGLVDELSGQLVALTDAVGLRRGQGLGPPPESSGYRPERLLDGFVRLRDRRCRFPGCRARPVSCDLDHEVPWPWGPTSHDNLCCLCRHHHRLSHQAPGWRLRGLAGGGLEWTTPGGIVATTHPPRFGADDDAPRAGDDVPRAGDDVPRAGDDLPRAGEGVPPPARPPAAAGAAPPADVGQDDPPPF